jgi:hypothetical protein
MAALILVLVVAACGAFMYLKGTFFKSFVMLMTAVFASVVAFGWFEMLAGLLISRKLIQDWAQLASFLVLFASAFAIFQAAASKLMRKPVELEQLTDRIGRIICSVLCGVIIAGVLLTALAMAPLATNVPYQRFEPANPDPQNPKKSLLNTDGLVAGCFALVSRGSLGANTSFAILHPDFLNQLHLDRQRKGISLLTTSEAIELPPKEAAWPAPDTLMDTDGKSVPQKSGHRLIIVRLGFRKTSLSDAGLFTLSQIRLIAKAKTDAKNTLLGEGQNLYPLGYLKAADQLQIKKLSDQIKIEADSFEGKARWIDFAFYVPNDSVPVLVEFKQNNVAQVPPLLAPEQIPAPVPFVQLSDCATESAQLVPLTAAKIYGIELGTREKLLDGVSLHVKDANEWRALQADQSIAPAKFDEEGKITYVRAELALPLPPTPNTPPAEGQQPAAAEKKPQKPAGSVAMMLKARKGYRLLSLKCNIPAVGAPTDADQLPILEDLTGAIHYPVGVIASGKVGEQTIYQVDYCSLSAEEMPDGLVFADSGAVKMPFPDSIWLTEKAQSIDEFYLLYLVKSGANTVISSARPAGSQKTAPLKEHEGFFIK